jgi:hypothetical protein
LVLGGEGTGAAQLGKKMAAVGTGCG